MKALVLIVLNGGLIIFFIYLLRQKGLLTYSHQGRIWLTWLAIAIITLMDRIHLHLLRPGGPCLRLLLRGNKFCWINKKMLIKSTFI